jgi:ABC-2 type transport system permease protein
MKRILAVARKETRHILRDPRSLAVAIAMPLMMVVLYGYAIDMELKHLTVAFLDQDHTPASLDLRLEMTSSNFITPVESLTHRDEIEPGFRQSRFRAVVIIPEGYALKLANRLESPVQILVDGADGSTAAVVDNYLQAAIARFNRKLSNVAFGVETLPIEPQTRILFNPQLISAHFIVPGLVALVLVMICALLTSIAIARERETGTLEQILTTPVAPSQVIIGKVLPYIGIGAVDAALILAVGRFVFDVPMNGSWWVLSAYTLLYIIISLALGLLISTFAKTQQVAMIAALMGTLLPTLLLSGFIFSISSMPWILQQFSRIIPATYYLVIIRGLMLKGQLWFPLETAVLTFLSILILSVATIRFKERLD